MRIRARARAGLLRRAHARKRYVAQGRRFQVELLRQAQPLPEIGALLPRPFRRGERIKGGLALIFLGEGVLFLRWPRLPVPVLRQHRCSGEGDPEIVALVAELRQALEGRLAILPRQAPQGRRQRRRSAVQVPPLILALLEWSPAHRSNL